VHLREDSGLGDPVELALVAERSARERLQDHVHRLLPPRAPALEPEPEALELVVLVAAAEPDVEPARGEEREGGDLLGYHQRVVERHHDDRGAHPDAGGPSAR
jgi:hypothetical protein